MRRLNRELLAGRPAEALDVESLQAWLREMRFLLDQLDALGLIDGERLGEEPLTELAVQQILVLLVELAFSGNAHAAVTVLGRAPSSYSESFDLPHGRA